MQCSNHYKKYENCDNPNRNNKGKKKPVALRNAKRRCKSLKNKYCK